MTHLVPMIDSQEKWKTFFTKTVGTDTTGTSLSLAAISPCPKAQSVSNTSQFVGRAKRQVTRRKRLAKMEGIKASHSLTKQSRRKKSREQKKQHTTNPTIFSRHVSSTRK